MEENKISLEELIQNWDVLRFELKRSGKFSFDVFSSTFFGTFQMLSQFTTEPHIHKDYLPLILNASLFANSECKAMEFKQQAALVLTERMLSCCLSADPHCAHDRAPLYVLSLRKEVYVNFNNVDESIDRLAKLFEGNYWDNRQ